MTPEQRKQAEEIISKYETYVRLSQPHNTTPIFLKENVLLMMEEYNQLSAPRIEITEEEKKAIDFIKENPYEDDFVSRSYSQTLYDGEPSDNSIECAEYWRKEYNKVINYLPRLSKPSGKTAPSNIPTDEEIYKAANANIKSTWKGHSQGYYYHFVEGAEWMREKLTGKKEKVIPAADLWHSNSAFCNNCCRKECNYNGLTMAVNCLYYQAKSEDQQKGAPFDEEKTMGELVEKLSSNQEDIPDDIQEVINKSNIKDILY